MSLIVRFHCSYVYPGMVNDGLLILYIKYAHTYVAQYNILHTCNRNVFTYFLPCSHTINSNNETYVFTDLCYMAYVHTSTPPWYVHTYIIYIYPFYLGTYVHISTLSWCVTLVYLSTNSVILPLLQIHCNDPPYLFIMIMFLHSNIHPCIHNCTVYDSPYRSGGLYLLHWNQHVLQPTTAVQLVSYG